MGNYKHGDLTLPSVTTILGAMMGGPPLQWAANETANFIRNECYHSVINTEDGTIYKYDVSGDELDEARFAYKRISQDALAIGSIAHSMIEDFLNSLEWAAPFCEDESQLRNCVFAFQHWFDEQDEIETISTEETVYGDYWAGTRDWRLKLNGEIGIIDFKTSKPPANTKKNRYQTAAYRSIEDDNVFHAILRLDKETGDYEFKDFRDTYEDDLYAFNKLKEAYLATHPIVAKRAGWRVK